MWARVHKIDRVRPQPGGSAIVLVEDERNAPAMGRVPALSALFAVARVLNARRMLEARFGGKGEIRYATAAAIPDVLLEAIIRAGASVSNSTGERIVVPAAPAAIAPIIDTAFVELAHHVRTNLSALDMTTALGMLETTRRKSPVDRDVNPILYWTSVFELAALAGERSRPRGGRWVDTTDMPVPYAIRFPNGEAAMPTKLAQQIVEGTAPEATLASVTPVSPTK